MVIVILLVVVGVIVSGGVVLMFFVYSCSLFSVCVLLVFVVLLFS